MFIKHLAVLESEVVLVSFIWMSDKISRVYIELWVMERKRRSNFQLAGIYLVIKEVTQNQEMAPQDQSIIAPAYPDRKVQAVTRV
jgi:hypothetical protein